MHEFCLALLANFYQTISEAHSCFWMFFLKSPFCSAFSHFVMIFQRENMRAFVISYYIKKQIQRFISKKQTKTCKKQNTLGMLKQSENTMSNCISLNFLRKFLSFAQLIREITDAKTQKWTIPPKNMALTLNVSTNNWL